MADRKRNLERARLGQIPSMAAEGTPPQEGSIFTKVPTMSAFEGTFFDLPKEMQDLGPGEFVEGNVEAATGLLSLAQLATAAGAKTFQGTTLGKELDKRSQQLADRLADMQPLLGGDLAITPLGRRGTRSPFIGTPASQRTAKANRDLMATRGRVRTGQEDFVLPRPSRFTPEGVTRPPPADALREARLIRGGTPTTTRGTLGLRRAEADADSTAQLGSKFRSRFEKLFPNAPFTFGRGKILSTAELAALQNGTFDQRLRTLERIHKLYVANGAAPETHLVNDLRLLSNEDLIEELRDAVFVFNTPR
jgi:hypothetical protein